MTIAEEIDQGMAVITDLVMATVQKPRFLWALQWLVTYVEEGCIGDEETAAEESEHVLNAATIVRRELLDLLTVEFGSFPYRPHEGEASVHDH